MTKMTYTIPIKPNPYVEKPKDNKGELAIFSTVLVVAAIALVCTLIILLTAVNRQDTRILIMGSVIMVSLLYISVITAVKLGNSVTKPI